MRPAWPRRTKHWTERRVRGHVAICVYASLIEALIARDLRAAHLRDPDLPDQHLSAARTLRESTAFAWSPSRPVTEPSAPSPGAAPSKPRSSAPSVSTPAPGTEPASPNAPPLV